MNKLVIKAKTTLTNYKRNIKRILANTEGDQITGWLIVILLVVVVGAFFLTNYQTAIIEIWDAIILRIKTAFGL